MWADPEAAAIVFACGRPITMIPLEVTHQALATDEILQRLRSSNRRVAAFAADLLVFFADSYRQVFGFPAPPVHDPCAVIAVLAPEIIYAHMMYVAVETSGELSVGQTLCDVYGRFGKEPTARVGYGLDVPRFWDIVVDTLLTYA